MGNQEQTFFGVFLLFSANFQGHIFDTRWFGVRHPLRQGPCSTHAARWLDDCLYILPGNPAGSQSFPLFSFHPQQKARWPSTCAKEDVGQVLVFPPRGLVSIESAQVGDILEGKVITRRGRALFLDVGAMVDAYLPKERGTQQCGLVRSCVCVCVEREPRGKPPCLGSKFLFCS